MKKLTKRLLAVIVSIVMVMAMAVTAMAQTEGTVSDGPAKITISNASKGVTYSVYKLFNASVTGTADGSIAYTGTIPETLKSYFTQDSAGNITATSAATVTSGDMSEGLRDALKAWTESATATKTAVSDGSTLEFVGLSYGYYVVTTTQGNTAITVTSTNPNASIIDKNSTPPVDNLKKAADDKDVNIGQTVKYTVSFNTANYTGKESGKKTAEKQIISYKIEDTLPDFLTSVKVTSIKVVEGSGESAETKTLTLQQFDSNKTITIPWVDESGNNLYANGATLEISYTAVVTDKAAIAGNGNKNTVTVTPVTGSGDDTPSERTESETIKTYAIALKKTDEKGNPLAGAKFQFPFYVKTTADTDGSYIYAGTTKGEGLTNEITTPNNGEITIKGVASGTYDVTEIEAPKGYNKLTSPVKLTAVETSNTTTNETFYLDTDGKVVEKKTETTVTVTYTNEDLAASAAVVVNKTGAELPSTGGIGTTLFYVIGAILVLGAGVLLVTRRRMSAK